MSEQYLRVHDWDKWQTFRKDRGTPPWIKVHRNLFTSLKWASMSDAEKGQLISIWIVAADRDGLVPKNEDVLRKVCFLDATPDVKKFIEMGLLEDVCQPSGCQGDAKKTGAGCQGDQPEESRGEKSRGEKNKYGIFENVLLTDDEFEKLSEKFNGTSQDRIDRLSEYIESKGKRYRSHYATILAWARRDGKNKNGNPAPASSDPAKNIYGKGAI